MLPDRWLGGRIARPKPINWVKRGRGAYSQLEDYSEDAENEGDDEPDDVKAECPSFATREGAVLLSAVVYVPPAVSGHARNHP